jgi:AcrR family transcriptional regulator
MSPRTAKQFEEIREEKRELISQTALKLFAKNGYHSTTINMIAKEAGISKGLLYNYYESKESLLEKIFSDYLSMMSKLINPNNDNEITNEEMSGFFDTLIESMINEKEYWAVLFQLTLQAETLDFISSRYSGTSETSSRLYALGYQYFAERFENPMEEIILFKSVLNGIAILLVFTPEVCPLECISSIKERIKKMFIVEKRVFNQQKKPSVENDMAY